MASTAANPALKAAHALLSRFDPGRQQLDDEVEKARRRLDAQSSGVLDGLTDAVMRHQALIDLLISHGSSVKTTKMENAVLAALRLGAASFLRGIPVHAAVNEAVELLPPNHRARGLVNAVMRRVTESVVLRDLTPDERRGLRNADSAALDKLLTPKSFTWNNERVMEARFALFPAERAHALRLLSGLPEWLDAKLHDTLADDEFVRMCVAAAEPPATWLRIVGGRETIAGEALEALAKSGMTYHKTGCAVRVESEAASALLRSPAFASGNFAVQDYAAQLPAAAAQVQPGWRCLDLCAAPGGKTCQLAEAALPNGVVLAFDQTEAKLKRIGENVGRLGLPNVSMGFGDGASVKLPGAGTFNCALLDAPCSNTGVMARRVEVKHRLKPADLASLKPLQRKLLDNAARHVKPGGTLVYSTCSLLDEENGALVREFLDAQGGDDSGWTMDDEQLTLPHAGDHDGGYFCVLGKPD